MAGPLPHLTGLGTGTAARSVMAQGVMVPNTPQSVLAYSAPPILGQIKAALQLPGSPAAPFFTVLTVESMIAPASRGISRAVSTSLMPWPRAPNTWVDGS